MFIDAGLAERVEFETCGMFQVGDHIVNDSGQCVVGWEVLFTPSAFEVTGSWNGRLAPADPGQVRLVNEAWNGNLCPRTSVTVGMQCAGTPEFPDELLFNGTAMSPAP